jgi:hypothetical protein
VQWGGSQTVLLFSGDRLQTTLADKVCARLVRGQECELNHKGGDFTMPIHTRIYAGDAIAFGGQPAIDDLILAGYSSVIVWCKNLDLI